jgi:hypothetical protein
VKAFDERHLVHFVVLNRPVAEIALLAEQLAVIGSDGDVGVRRQQVEQALEDTVEIAHGLDLAGAQAIELGLIELGKFFPRDELAADESTFFARQ